jgi:hypothetical protein
MPGIGNSLIVTFDYVWERFNRRLDGLTDDEYRWEPVAGCWNLRPGADGRWTMDAGREGEPWLDPAPVTTIAWRIGHVAGSAVAGFAERLFPETTTTTTPAADIELPGTAAEVPGFLERTYRPWREGMQGLTDDGWWAPLGRVWGPYARSTPTDLALHVLDEVVHHTAEVALLRDLYRERATLGDATRPPS